jgi:hypothetical protein
VDPNSLSQQSQPISATPGSSVPGGVSHAMPMQGSSTTGASPAYWATGKGSTSPAPAVNPIPATPVNSPASVIREISESIPSASYQDAAQPSPSPSDQTAQLASAAPATVGPSQFNTPLRPEVVTHGPQWGEGGNDSQPPVEPKVGRPLFRRGWLLGTIATALLMVAIGGFIVLRGTSGVDNTSANVKDGNYTVTSIPLSDLANGNQLSIDSGKQLSVNGQLRINDSAVLTPSAQPTNPTNGQMYLDKDTNQLMYYNGTQFVPLATSIGGQAGTINVGSGINLVNSTLVNSGVVSIQGQTGAVNFSSGGGISLNGTTITNTGVLRISGTPGQLNVSNNNGNVQISLNGISPNSVVAVDANGALTSLAPSTFGLCLISTPSGPAFGSCTGTAQVTDINSLTGSLTIAAGAGISVTPSGGNTLTIASTAGVGLTSVNGQTGPALTVANATAAGNTITINTATSGALGLVKGGGTGVTINGGGALSIGQDVSTSANVSFGSVALTTALAVTSGGTGQSSLTANALLVGNGTNAVSLVSAVSNGQCLLSTGSGPQFQSCPVGGNVNAGISQTAGRLTMWDSTVNTIVDSLLGQASGTITAYGDLVINPGKTISGDGSGLTNVDAITLQGHPASDFALDFGTLSVNRGGTGQSSLTANSVLVGNGTSAVNLVSAASNGQCFMSSGSGPVFQSCPVGGNVSAGVSQTAGRLTMWDPTVNTITDSLLGQASSTITSYGDLVINSGKTISGDGSGLTTLNASNVSSGTLSDTRLSANVALLNGTNTFTGANIFRNNSTAAFKVQQSAGGNQTLVVDTTNNAVGIGAAPTLTDVALQVTGAAQFWVDNTNKPAVDASHNGSIYYDTIDSKFKIIEGGVEKDLCNTVNQSCGAGTGDIQLQTAYAGGNTIDTADNRDIKFSLMNTATDSNFLVDIKSGSTGKFAVQNNGTDVLSVTSSAATVTGNLTVNSGQINGNGAGITNLQAVNLSGTVATGNGGTGLTSFTSRGVLYASNTSTLAVTAAGTNGDCLVQTAGGPQFQSCSAASSVTSTSATPGKIAKFGASGTIITDSILTESSSNISVGGTLTVTGANSLSLGQASSNTGSILFNNATNAFTTKLQSGVPGSNITLTLPTAVSAGCLKSDVSGVLSFATCLSGSGGGGGVTDFNGDSGSVTLQGTANQIAVTGGSGAYTLSTPQDIGLGSAVQFGSLKVGAPQGSVSPAASNGSIVFYRSDTTNTITLQSAAAPTGNIAITIPNAAGTVAVSASGPLSLNSTSGNLSLGTVGFGNGGTNATSYNTNGVVYAGASSLLSTSAGTDGQILVGRTGTTPTFATVSGDGTISNTGALTVNTATSSTKGIASFNSTNLTVSSGAVNTVQGISTSATPQFAGLAINQALNGSSAAKVQVSGGVQLTTGSSPGSYSANLAGTIYYDSADSKFKIYEAGGSSAAIKTLCNTTDLGCGNAATTTLAQAYTNFGASPAVINLNTSANGIAIKDTAGGIGVDLFTVQSNAGTKYLNVNASGASVQGTLSSSSDFSVNTNKFTVAASSGNTAVGGTLGVASDLAVNTNKFTVVGASGNTAIAGTLGVTGDVAINTNKFTVAAASGNTVVAGTLGVASDVAINTNKFTVQGSSGNTLVAGTLAVAGATTLTGALNANGGVTTSTTNGNLTLDANGTGQVQLGGTSTGNILLAGGLGTTGCTITNSTGAFACDGSINSVAGINTGAGAGTQRIDASGNLVGIGSISTTGNLLSVNQTNSGVGINQAVSATGAKLQVTGGVQLTAGSAPVYATALAGTIYYDSTDSKFKIYEAGGSSAALKTLCNTIDGCATAGGAVTLNGAYANYASSPAAITLDATRLGVVIKDASTPIASDLFTVQSNAGTKFLNVTATGASVQGTLSSSSDFAVNTNKFTVAASTGNTVVAGTLVVTDNATFNGGTNKVQSTVNSATAFQVQNSSSQVLFNVDTAANGLSLGNAGLAGTIQIGNTTGAVAQTINIGNNATASSTNTVNIGSSVGSSATTIKSGTGNINLSPSGASDTGVIVKPGTDSANVFNIQNAAGVNLLNADTSGMAVNLNAAVNVTGIGQPSPTLSSSGVGGTLAANTYYYRVAARNVNGQSGAVATSPPSATTTGSTSSNTISWSAVTGATNYYLYRSTDNITFLRVSLGNVTTAIDNGSNFTWSGSDHSDDATVNESSYFSMAKGGQIALDSSGNGVLYENLSNSSVILAAAGGGQAVVIQADSFYVQDTTGYNDNLRITNTGAALFKNRTNSTSGFSVQNVAGASIFNVDTTNAKIGTVNTTTASTASQTLTIKSGDASGATSNSGNVILDSGSATGTAGSVSVGTGAYAHTTTVGNVTGASGLVLQAGTGNVSINGAAGTNYTLGAAAVAGTISVGGTAQTGTITVGGGTGAQSINLGTGGTAAKTVTVGSTAVTSATTLQSGTGGILLNADGGSNTGVISKTTNNSTAAFQIQNSGNTNILNADTSANVLTAGAAYSTGLTSADVNAWATSTNYNITVSATSLPRQYHGAVTYNGYIYTVGGYDTTSAAAKDTVQYAKLNSDGTISSGAWTAANAINVGGSQIRQMHGTVVANGYLYVLGGTNTNAAGGAQSTVYYAKINTDGSLGSWLATTSLTAARYGGTTVYANGYIYVIGGANASGTVQSNIYYGKVNADGTISSWTTTNLGSSAVARFQASAQVANGNLYIMGGSTTTAATGGVATSKKAKINADGSLTFSADTSAIFAARSGGSTAVLNGYMYYFGGLNTSSAGRDNIYYASINADGTLGTWVDYSATRSLTYTTYGNATVVVNGNIYAIGGFNAALSATSNVVAIAATPKLKVAGSLDLLSATGGTLGDTGGGGSLTAGNTNIVGTLDVGGNANFMQGVNLTSLSASGQVAFRNSSNSTTAVQIQNSNGQSLLTADTTNINLSLVTGTASDYQTWQTGANPLPQNRFSPASAMGNNGYAYVIGGAVTDVSSTLTFRNSVYYAKLNNDGSTGTWQCQGDSTNCGSSGVTITNNRSLPASYYEAASVVLNGYIYVIGGNTNTNDSTITASTAIYYAKLNADGSTGTWQTGTALPAGRSDAQATVYNGQIYVVAGHNGTQSTVKTYHAKQNGDGSLSAKWTCEGVVDSQCGTGGTYTVGSTSELAGGVTDATVFMANGYLYRVGGANGGPLTNYDSVKIGSDGTFAATWSRNTLTNALNHAGGIAFVQNGYVYLAGGYDYSPGDTALAQYAPINSDGTLGAAVTTTGSTHGSGNQLPADRSYFGSSPIINNGYMYIIGGLQTSGNAYKSTVYYSSTSRIRVGAQLDLIGNNSTSSPDAGGGSLNAGNTNVVGTFNVQGAASFGSSMTVAGDALFTGSFTFTPATDSATAFQVQKANGTAIVVVNTSAASLAVSAVTITGTLTVNGHIVTGGGTAPTVSSTNANLGTTGQSCSTSIAGNDTAGKITITSGSGGSPAAGALCVFNISAAFGSTPHVYISPNDSTTAKLNVYAKGLTSSTFEVGAGNAPAASTAYTFEYLIAQ